MMLGMQHVGCGGTLLVARNITIEEEERANRFEDAAILVCNKCGERIVDDVTSSRPDRYRKPRVPDQSVFEVSK
jgi:YgiT-type zinc finger domain-containing protein